MIYNLSNIIQAERFKKRCNELYDQGKTVELTDKTIRSVKQNRYLHLILTWFAIETGNTLQDVKVAYFKRLCNKDLFISTKICTLAGEIESIRSTKDVSKMELTTSIERFRNWAGENGIYLPSPEEREFLNEIQVEADRKKRYL